MTYTARTATDRLDEIVGYFPQPLRNRFHGAVASVGAIYTVDATLRTADDWHDRYTINRRNAESKLRYDDPDEITFTFGEIIALGSYLLLEEIDDRYSAELDDLFRRNDAGEFPRGRGKGTFGEHSDKLDRRIRNARNKVTLAAFGVTYAAWMKFLNS